MRVKKYIVDTMPEAMHKIRNELGKDAVILNTKAVKLGGFLGLFGKKKIEVIAATDTAAQEPPAAKTSAAVKFEQALQHAAAPAETAPPPTSSGAAQALAASLPPAAAAKAYAAGGGARTALPEEHSSHAPAPSPLAAATRKPSEHAEHVLTGVTPVAPRDDRLYEEIRQMKELVHKLSRQGGAHERTPEALVTLEKHLRHQDISEELLSHLMDHVTQTVQEADLDPTEAETAQLVSMELIRIMTRSDSMNITSSARVIHFVGPTGVGKTTTIAKLAAEQVLKYNRKVGFITSDTYRIAAIDQLRTYATILNVPMEVVFSPQELTRAFRNLSECDMIFMDTAGRNFRNEMYVSELNSLLRSEGVSETYLVLSLTMKYRDMKAVAENFIKYNVDKVLFTKADETDSYGAVANLMYDFDLKLSYVTHGQNVPDDIKEADVQRLTEQLMEGYGHE
ncbi:hypothetical protein SY83_16120 [Paenibacillus swuensis]|uniref:Flagellar biosynthesis protein FlhF n=1 Tax=Paenibacillus swuensis TaxID=1178515 RepID=A0A172TKW0_9BACL|nr:flagellar biosynthesis protein FlhF [Paenibacillus swuensis]ANE47554.1 hypothetical protein SY83_16120 [Paenibacillus swuensis]